ncbi:uncharacterized protein LOC110726294 [Chenopodium quinoa]|uniref:uncharacterized protein LOC110726294 n=1 Tax=Chenopodium quinoa TaxID=63459 RepID=UPI000B77D64A|nr:uncharacterized protein LOC110726294 [Chenopodium quinoa]
MWIEEWVKSSNKTHPRFNHYCQSGQVILPLLPLTPPFLMSILPCQQFRSNIRAFNSMLAFTSMGGRIDNTVNDGRGPYVYSISGSNYHRIGTLLPEPGTGPKSAQLYIYDTDNETSIRLHYMGGTEASSLDPKILQGLKTMLDDINPYVAVFRNAGSMLLDQCDHQDLRIKLIFAREGRQYIQPTASEVAALMVGDETEDTCNRDIILQKVDGGLQRIDETHPSYMPLQYPLLFPYGTDGWRAEIPKVSGTSNSRNTVTMQQFYAFRIHDKEEEGDTLIDVGRLLEQFVVDAYVAMEQYRLLFIRRNQGRLRSDLYNGLQDAITAGDVNAIGVGRKFILPSSFTRSPRNMAHHYQDAIAIVRFLGPPDLFITFTYNPNWPKIVNEIFTRGSRRTEDRPDIIARVFKIKLKRMLRDLKDERKFGKVIAEDKPKCPKDIDVLVSAKIPHKDTDPLAYETVTKNMLHGPCGPCLIYGKYSKHFPKKFLEETTFDDNGFVQYRRRQNREPIIVNGREVDNRWVVPYNRDLCVKYNAHINVELVAARGVFHLPSEQFVVFNDNDDMHTILEQPRLQQTMLNMWFQANKDFPEANQYTYQNFPTGFRWDLSLKRWTQRQIDRPCIGILPFVHPNSGERYYLRMLLTKVSGAKSFEDIQTIDGVIHPTFRFACHALGLFDDDNEWLATLSEASNWLREQHWGELTDDLERMMQRQTRNPNLRLTPEEMQNQGVQEIKHILNKLGRSLSNFLDMPQPSLEIARNALNRLISDELDYDSHYEANRFDTLVKGWAVFFVYGSGGTGKTYLWNTLIEKIRSERKIMLFVASSGIAA